MILKAQSRAEKKVKDRIKPRGRGKPHPYERGNSHSIGRSDPSPRAGKADPIPVDRGNALTAVSRGTGLVSADGKIQKIR